jgi:FMN phosphatase YigB (HAD superfamily)
MARPKNNLMLKAVVFDVGETLVNEHRLWRAWAAWLGVPEHAFFAVLGSVIERGEHHHRVFELLRPGFDLAAARAERLRAGVSDLWESSDLYPDAAPCLTALARRGLRIGVAANQPAGSERVLHGLGLRLDLVASSGRWGVAKPSPEFFQRIVQELEIEPSAIAYVGDRLDNDVLPAQAAGMFGVLIRRGPWGYLHWNRPEAAQANLRITSLTELPDALENVSGVFVLTRSIHRRFTQRR